jgi:hypothetical protein
MQEGLSTYDFECFCWRRLFQRKQTGFCGSAGHATADPAEQVIFKDNSRGARWLIYEGLIRIHWSTVSAKTPNIR